MHTLHPFVGLSVPPTPEKYSRLFPSLPALTFDDDAARAWAAAMSSNETDDNPSVPAGYTYFAQFVSHDLNFDPVSNIARKRAPESLLNYRTPRLDLDSVYGLGPEGQPAIYDAARVGQLLVGRGMDHRVTPNTPTVEDDLPRNYQGTALVGDPRNDQNVIISQLQLAFLRLHNRIAKSIVDGRHQPLDAFAKARNLVQRHYQWVVLHDLLPRLIGAETIASILPAGEGTARQRFRGVFFSIDGEISVPLEFSGAAYRMGHSMIRDEYVLNDNFQQRLGPRVIFHPQGNEGPVPDLRGGRFLPWGWSIQWDRFVQFVHGRTPQASQLINPRLAPALRNVPGFDPADLAYRDILRGRSYGLPSGQAVAEAMGLQPLETERPEPLWIYILREAWETQRGRRLGPVGSRIVGEVMVGVLAADEASFVNADPGWQPRPDFFAPGSDRFELKDLVYAAGLPCNRSEWNSWVESGAILRADIGPTADQMWAMHGGKGGPYSSLSMKRGGHVEAVPASDER